VNGYAGNERWFRGVDFAITNRIPLDEAKAAFRAEYLAWRRETGKPT
jgi:hypothetical protein